MKIRDSHAIRSSFLLAFLRDGVTGSTSGFELESEGSIPSPVANFSNARWYFDTLHKEISIWR